MFHFIFLPLYTTILDLQFTTSHFNKLYQTTKRAKKLSLLAITKPIHLQPHRILKKTSKTMGSCLSCLIGNSNDDEYNETSSLLRNQHLHQQYSSDYLQEEQIMKQQQRQQELTSIVNELNDKLIDVTSFLNGSSSLHSVSNNNLSINLNGNSSGDNLENEDDNGHTKTFPYVYSKQERDEVANKANAVGDDIKQTCKITSLEPLYIKF